MVPVWFTMRKCLQSGPEAGHSIVELILEGDILRSFPKHVLKFAGRV
jgi:hypothetical protein